MQNVNPYSPVEIGGENKPERPKLPPEFGPLAIEYADSFAGWVNLCCWTFRAMAMLGCIGFIVYLCLSPWMFDTYKKGDKDLASYIVFPVCASFNILFGIIFGLAVGRTCKKFSIYENGLRLFRHNGSVTDIHWKNTIAMSKQRMKDNLFNPEIRTKTICLEYRDSKTGKKRKQIIRDVNVRDLDGLYAIMSRLYEAKAW